MKNLYLFRGNFPGPTVVIFGGTHGNEASGVIAIKRLIENIQKGIITPKRGALILIAGVNEKALAENVRGIKDSTGTILDMNRFFRPNPPKTDGYEYERSRELMPIIENADYLLDLHSTSGPSEPYAFAENGSIGFAEKLGIGHIVSGWGQIQGWDGSEMTDSPLAGDIESYATSHGAIGVTFESGNHDAPGGEKNAYQVAINFMTQAGILDEKHYKKIHPTTTKIHMTRVYQGINDIFTYAFNITSNFMPLRKGTLIGHDGHICITTPEDCILVMPTLDKNSENTATGQKNKNIFQIGRYSSD